VTGSRPDFNLVIKKGCPFEAAFFYSKQQVKVLGEIPDKHFLGLQGSNIIEYFAS